MFPAIIRTSGILVLTAAGLLADFSMEQTSQVTGGMMAGAMKLVGVFSRQAREPMHATVAVKGDRMVHLSPTHAQIVDLSKETITNVDFQHKTYSVMTFEQMKQALDDLAERMHQSKEQGADMKFKVSVNPTGQTKQIDGFEAKETILKVEVEGTDAKSGQTGAMTMTSEIWLAPKVAGYGEITDFYKRMGQKLDWTPGGNMWMARPDIAKSLGELYKQAGNLDGMPVYQVIKMGAEGTGAQASGGSQSAPPPKTESQASKPSSESVLGAALGGKLGRFGGFGHKKKQDTPPADQAAAPAQPASAPQGDASAALLEMTIQASNFSSASVDSAKFEIPAGFKQVEAEMLKHTRQR